jgi:predicted RNA-binding protein with PIN domain
MTSPVWIVDGNNVMGAVPDGWWHDRELGMQRLVDRLDAWAADTGHEVLVVFDGRPRDVHAERVAVLFAPHADDVIARRARRADTVATSDRELQRRVAARGAQVLGARALRARID